MKYTLEGTSKLVVLSVQVNIPGVPIVTLGVKGLVEVLKLKVVAAIGVGFETPPPLERQSDSRAAPVWQAERVEPLIVVLSDVSTRLNGSDVSL